MVLFVGRSEAGSPDLSEERKHEQSGQSDQQIRCWFMTVVIDTEG